MDTNFSETRAYHRDGAGLLSTITILLDATGTPHDSAGCPLEHTNLTVTLKGWPDNFARVWLNGGGLEILVPEKMPSVL